MPELSEVSYSGDACIEAIHDYYQFLTKVYLNESDVVKPPEGGWPSIAAEALDGLKKSGYANYHTSELLDNTKSRRLKRWPNVTSRIGMKLLRGFERRVGCPRLSNHHRGRRAQRRRSSTRHWTYQRWL
jgi:hypothetical protein